MVAAAAPLGVIFAVPLAITGLLVGLAPWLAFLIATAAMGAIAFVLAQSGIAALKKKSIAPVETMHSLKETTQWLKNGTR